MRGGEGLPGEVRVFMQRPEGLGKETWGIRGEKRRHDMEACVRGSPLCPQVQPGMEWRDAGIMGCGGRGQGATELHPAAWGPLGPLTAPPNQGRALSREAAALTWGPQAHWPLWDVRCGETRAEAGHWVQGGTAQPSGGAGADARVGKAPKTVPCSLSQALALTDP